MDILLQSSMLGVVGMTKPGICPSVQKLLTPFIDILEGTFLWAWGGVLLAVVAAVTIPKIVNLRVLQKRQYAGEPRGLSDWRSGNEADMVSPDACCSSGNDPQEKNTSRLEKVSGGRQQMNEHDFDGSTKNRLWWEENQIDAAETDDWKYSIFGREIVRSWPRQPDSICGRPTTISLSHGSELTLWDPRVSHQSPVFSGQRNPFHKPENDRACPDVDINVSFPDLRMLRSNGRVVSTWPDDSSPQYANKLSDMEFVLVNNIEDEFPDAGDHENVVHYSELGTGSNVQRIINSRSMAFWLLNSVRSLSYGLATDHIMHSLYS